MFAEFVNLKRNFAAGGLGDDLLRQVDAQPIAWRGLGFPKQFINNISFQNNG